jgi:rubrerythrin
MMKTYLGEQPDELDALEFLSIAEGGEVIHYEILSKLATKFKDKKLAKDASSILPEEKKHLQMCIQLEKSISIKE